MAAFEILCGIVALLLAVYYYSTKNYNYWEIRKVPGPKPSFPFGNIKDSFFGRKNLGDLLKQYYDEFKNEPYFGIFLRATPVLILRDPELIKDVLIKDFSTFADRGIPVFEKADPLSQHLLSLEPKRWRPLRNKLSPVFTSGKLREMFYLLLECAQHFEKYIEHVCKKDEPVECRELTAKFTTDVIGTCAFGIEMNAMADEDSEFRQIGRELFQPSFRRIFRDNFRSAFPKLYELSAYVLPRPYFVTFFINIIRETIDHREKNDVTRHDFIDLLRNMKKNPNIIGDIELTDSLLAAQCFVFFLAGFETSSTTMSNTLYEMALNQNIQDKLRKEIRDSLKETDGKLTYESVKKMEYFDMVFNETLRKYPPATILVRKSTEQYKFEGTELTIPKNTRVWVPVYAIHRDPEIYPKPDIFEPERFSKENMKNRNPMHYLAFGDGPRNCIGARFANYQSKVGLISILKNFKVDVCEKTTIPYVNHPRAFLLSPINGIQLKISKVTET